MSFRLAPLWPSTSDAVEAADRAEQTLVRRALLLAAMLNITGCHTGRPSFMTRVEEDCSAGDEWACDLLNTLRRSRREREGEMRRDAD